MTITVLTIIMLCMMFRPDRSSGMYNFSVIFRILWLVPICITWMIYMAIKLILSGNSL